MSQIKEIKAPIVKELDIFEQRFAEAVKSKVPMLDRIMHYIVHRKGKQIRPMIVLLATRLLAPINDRAYRAASLIELLHTATLVHDDVVDDSMLRRGFFSINALWKNKAAVLVGDYLLSKGLLLSLENKDFDLLTIVTDAVKELSEGELLQMEKSRGLNLDEDIYYEIIAKKTASLIKAACGTGVASVSSDEAWIQKAKDLGMAMGMAFQIKDDLLDYGTDDIGKPTGNDLKEKKLTLPIIHALKNCTAQEKKEIMRMVPQVAKNKKLVPTIVEFVNKYQGIQYAQKVMQEYKNRALQILKEFPESDANTSFAGLIHYVVERNK